ncbi:ABC transporter permease [Paenibacillus donghaensis]|uniref:Transport permease protein n=1 Tax=Paenibacillus donghaensis TaxID=414771 RepID=A0A2Z2KQ43_9BACL|nr:ABC transporter permease [Paenibacillus donghaensis]ASA25900.1 ABC transporter permease [Paenibacillus donghaensis]
MLKDIWFLVTRTLRATFRKRSTLLLYFGLPIAGILLCTVLYGSQGEAELRVGVVNSDGEAQIAMDTIGFVKSMDTVKLVEVTADELKQQLAASDLDLGLILDPGYSQSVLEGLPAHITIQSVKGAEVTAYMKALLYGYIDNISVIAGAAEGDGTKFDELNSLYRNADFKLATEAVADSSAEQRLTFQSIGFLLLFMMTSAFNLSELIIRNRENRTYFRVLSSPINARTYVLSNIIVNLIIMVLQIAVTLFFMQQVFGLNSGVPAGRLFLLLSMFALVSVSISLVIVSLARSTAAASALQNLIITPTCFISGCFFPISIMPDTVQRIASFLPQTWVLESFSSLQSGTSLAGISFDLVVLFAFAMVFFLIATYSFGRNNDTRNFV